MIRDADGAAGPFQAAAGLAGRLDPIDGIFHVLAQQRPDALCHAPDTLHVTLKLKADLFDFIFLAREFFPILRIIHDVPPSAAPPHRFTLCRQLTCQAPQALGQFVEGRREGVGDDALLSHAAVLRPLVAKPAVQQVEHFVGRLLHEFDLLCRGQGIQPVQRGEKAAAGFGRQQGVREIPHLRFRDADAKVLGRDGLDRVAFVEHDKIVFGQYSPSPSRPRLLDRQIRKEQRVVAHQDLAVGDSPARGLVEAAVVIATAPAQAVAAFRTDFVPHLPGRLAGHVREAAVLGLLRPLFDKGEIFGTAAVGKEVQALFAGLLQPPQAEVVAAALAEHGREFLAADGTQKGDVLLDQLFLKGNGVGGDDDLFALGGLGDGRDEVGEAFAHAGAGLDDEVRFPLEGGFDRAGHFLLLGPQLEALEAPGDRAGFAKKISHGNRHAQTLPSLARNRKAERRGHDGRRA